MRINPFDENVQLVSSFFKKPLTITVSIFYMILALLSITGNINGNVWSIVSIGMVMLLFVLKAISYILFYKDSKKGEVLVSDAILFKITSLYKLLLWAGVLAYLGKETYTHIKNVINYNISLDWEVFVIYVLVVLFLLFYCISSIRFANSIKKSITSIYLNKKGAGGYSLASFLFALIIMLVCGLAVAFVVTYFRNPILVETVKSSTTIINACLLLLSAVTLILEGILAFKYVKYITEVNESYTVTKVKEIKETEENPFEGIDGIGTISNICKKCGKTYSDGDAFCSSCGSPINR